MSTRGCVAIAKGDGYKGVYNHSDSYPTWLGAHVFEHLQERLAEDGSLKPFAKKLAKHRRWETYIEEGRDAKGLGLLTPETVDPLFIEWVYVIDADENSMTVLASVSEKGTEPGNVQYREPLRRKDGAMDYGNYVYRHKLVAVIRIGLDEPEPDWEEIEARRDE